MSLPAAAQLPLPANGAHYSVTQNGKTLGEAQFAVAPVAGGNTLTASGHMQLNTFSYSFHDQATVDAQGNLVRDALTGSVQGAKASGKNIQFTTASDATGRNFQIAIDADGKRSTNAVDRHRNTVIAPDLDPAAYTLMVKIAREHPQTAWVLIPKETGPAGTCFVLPAGRPERNAERAKCAGQALGGGIERSKLNRDRALCDRGWAAAGGRPDAQNFHVVRDGFTLLNRPKPVAPPAGEPPQQDPNAQGAPQQGQPDPNAQGAPQGQPR